MSCLNCLCPECRPPVAVISTETIINAVARHFHIHGATLLGRERTLRVAFARQTAMYLTRELSGMSFPEIGRAFNRDHSTVIHACQLIARRMADSPPYRVAIERLKLNLITVSGTRETTGVAA